MIQKGPTGINEAVSSSNMRVAEGPQSFQDTLHTPLVARMTESIAATLMMIVYLIGRPMSLEYVR